MNDPERGWHMIRVDREGKEPYYHALWCTRLNAEATARAMLGVVLDYTLHFDTSPILKEPDPE